MNDISPRKIKTGGDPRTLSDYTALRDELSKLTHPARPDVNWRYAEKLCLSLFEQNGVELQTAAWYTLARTQLAGLFGLNEGLTILEALISHQWGALWPQPVHARMEILSSLSQRLQSVLRTLTLHYADLPQVYLAEQHLDALRDTLQRLELKNVSQVETLCTFMLNAAIRLENMDTGNDISATGVLPAPAIASQSPASTDTGPLIYVAREEPATPRVVIARLDLAGSRKGFAAGMLTMLITGSAGLWGWHNITPTPVSPVPVAADEATLKTLEQLPPLWRQEYGFVVVARAESAEAEKLKTQWQQYLSGNALPPEMLSGWHLGMEGLQALTRRLNALDERKGRYLTGSELKSMVFAITQNFERSVPVEERLYGLSQHDDGTPLPAAQVRQTDMVFNQLLNRYALIKQQEKAP